MNNTASVPLTQALPWPSPPPADGRFFLVCDSLETDGRFVLHTLATQVLAFSSPKSSAGSLLWLACGPWTDLLIANALKKLGCEAAASYLRSKTRNDANPRQEGSAPCIQPLHIRGIPVELCHRLEDSPELDVELFMKELYGTIRSWAESSDHGWIILDDISALASLVGERLTYGFVLSLRALARRTNTLGILIKCSQDGDQQTLKDGQTTSISPGNSDSVDWVGAGGRGTRSSLDILPWERHLPELSDGIIDVMPLASGYSREAHGRIVITARPGGRGWGDGSTSPLPPTPSNRHTASLNPLSPLVMNYCCNDTSISAIRLRGPSAS